MDPYKSGYLLRDEFKEILLEFCPELNEQELNFICEKYENSFDSRINYQLFLQPYTANQKLQPTMTSPRGDAADPLIQKLKYRVSYLFPEVVFY
jgi:Ca2+-binding EF-hand superfamily protein